MLPQINVGHTAPPHPRAAAIPAAHRPSAAAGHRQRWICTSPSSQYQLRHCKTSLQPQGLLFFFNTDPKANPLLPPEMLRRTIFISVILQKLPCGDRHVHTLLIFSFFQRLGMGKTNSDKAYFFLLSLLMPELDYTTL